MTEIINAKVNIDIDHFEITLPKVFDVYKSDFGGNEDSFLQFIFRYVDEEHDYDEILQQVKSKNVLIKYE